ncbi:hypothetical protein FNE58_01825 [Bacillus thuringiensis]|uniref:Uncharacterized protein n=1 Tax=Bacillus thuringiensis TaxID=1428 RepID=A0A643MK19_BACTU|nr:MULTISPECIES: hypothetical protein [Bacillus cereus group]AHZ49091.1 hypothetical protein YBT1520_01590 [Bacillus thuringiensis serovar kurstaki str. YBT-1520]AIM28434.1 hypothetical protein DF16_orf00018 [Bacillus thuringiensis serovar kurstaki str. YBT-1520]ETE99311.1 hypothetical protein C623_0204820 [Bacillus thuringiensis serovar aizawai str. Hu4-2]KAB1348301.1 hypothetical protein FPG91_25590 [Bacillus thuringiensis]KAB1348622.1 hypothetical protein FPG90_27515 [Bacillus thuringiensis
MKKYQIVYSVFSPSGQQYKEKFIEIYAPTVEHAKHGIETELKRRMGNLYQWQIDVQQIEGEQLSLF